MIGNKTVVYTSGTFDMLHTNHLRLLEYARGLGDILIVGVNTDELVAKYKAIPMIPFEERIAIIRALKGPDLVVPQWSLDHRDKVRKLKFDVFVVGDDWAGKYDYLEEQGVSVVYTPYGRGVSSTELRARIVRGYKKMVRHSETLLPDNAVELEQEKRNVEEQVGKTNDLN